MAKTILGRKLGMSQIWSDDDRLVPVTVIEAGPCVISQVKTVKRDGYAAVQLAFGDIKESKVTKPMKGHFDKAKATPKRYVHEARIAEDETYKAGQTLTVDIFEVGSKVDVVGTSKGKGFAGVMKRWHFKGMFASHGTERKHRSPGSIGSLCSNRGFGGGLAKGKKMAGHMGAERVTTRSLDIVRIDAEKGLLLVKGPIPGHNNAMVQIRPAVRLYKSKAKLVAGKK
jgi:large subunit ribosomal protein L3